MRLMNPNAMLVSDNLNQYMTINEMKEEGVDIPLYHIQSYGTGGATSFTFFNTAVGSATNAYADTNMDGQAMLSAGKRFIIYGIGFAYFPGPAPVQFTDSGPVSPLNDLSNVMQGIASAQLTVLDKTYYQCAPLAWLPAGFGVWSGGAALQRTQSSAADGVGVINQGVNGMPVLSNFRRLKVPVPIPQQTRFQVTVTFPSAITVGTAGRFGCFLDGLLIRAVQ